jgi:hypothetical protein
MKITLMKEDFLNLYFRNANSVHVVQDADQYWLFPCFVTIA